MLTKLKNKGVRALTLFLSVLMALQLGAVTTFATTADECDHEYTYDLQFDFYELNYTTEYICLTCYDAFATSTEKNYHYINASAEGRSCSSYTSGKVLTSVTHYTGYVYGVEGVEDDMSDWGPISAHTVNVAGEEVYAYEYYGWDENELVDADYVGVSFYFEESRTELPVKFDSISVETVDVTAEPVTGQFYSSNGKTGLSATWVLWDGETELTDTQAATLTDTKTMYYYSTGSNRYYPFSGYQGNQYDVTILTQTCTK